MFTSKVRTKFIEKYRREIDEFDSSDIVKAIDIHACALGVRRTVICSQAMLTTMALKHWEEGRSTPSISSLRLIDKAINKLYEIRAESTAA